MGSMKAGTIQKFAFHHFTAIVLVGLCQEPTVPRNDDNAANLMLGTVREKENGEYLPARELLLSTH